MKKNDLKYSGAGYDTIYNQDDYEYKQKLFVDNTNVKSLLDFILHEYKVSGRKSLQTQFD